ncbi:LysR family transcriptional regulator [Horticoccus luteus]|uniref:LysR family transcriptional regulator n=1 Tax=Horticoccus luteus TaxID=2862869 RepID=A0A8F9XHZ0_9BACT|nr:LysR family transcriptional regulator [Horticoccus luteus]QYM80782.1 LysR family transcriptional regulator [Horticoccus luteus]
MPREYQYPFELRHLVYFREVARQLHFRQAAETLAVAQPALSRAIAQLEAALGCPLLNRTRRGVEVTPAGRLLLERMEPLLRGLAALPAELRALATGQTGHIRVAFTGLAMATVLPGILREFGRRFPGVRVELNESPTSAQLAALRAGEVHCGFFHPAGPTAGLRTRVLLHERNGVLLPSSHPLASAATVRLRALADTPFVLFPRSHNAGFYDRILAAFTRAGVTPRIADEVWPRTNAIGLVRAGLGATFMTPSEARHLPPDVVFHALGGPAPESRLVLGWREDATAEPALASFLAVAAGDHTPQASAKGTRRLRISA